MARKTALGALMLACLTGLGLIILYPTFRILATQMTNADDTKTMLQTSF